MAKRQPATDRGRAWYLLVGGASGALVVWLAAMVGLAAVRGPSSVAGAAAGGVLTWAFFVLGQLVQVALAKAEPMIAMMSAMLSYAVRVVGLVLVALALNRFWPGLDSLSIAVAAIAVAIGWTAAEIWAFTRLRIPTFDPPQGEMR